MLHFFSREQLMAHGKEKHWHYKDFYDNNRWTQTLSMMAWRQVFKVYQQYSAPNNICQVCQINCHCPFDLQLHMLSNHCILEQCPKCTIMMEPIFFNIHMMVECDNDRFIERIEWCNHNPELMKQLIYKWNECGRATSRVVHINKRDQPIPVIS